MQVVSEKLQTLLQSERWFHKAQHCIPGGVNSPVRAFGAVGGIPRFISSAKGAFITDVDGNEYIDYVGSWGPMILGHAHEAVLQAVQNTAKNGLSFGAPSPLEVELAECVKHILPHIEKIRMVNSGTEATMTAIRLARAITGRNKIIKFEGCYHGHADCLLVKAGSGALTFGTPSSPGVPADCTKDTLTATYNDLDSVRALFTEYPKQIAAIILEPIPGNMNMLLPQAGFLETLRACCDQDGALLILDEVMSGFRVDAQGAYGLYPVQADITTFGKIIGGGMPVGAFGARAEIMDHLAPIGRVYQAGTLSGNPLAMAAGLATLHELQKPTIYPRLFSLTQQLIEGLLKRAQAAGIPLTANYRCGMFGLFFISAKQVWNYQQVLACNKMQFNVFFHAMLSEGVYLAPSMFEAGFVSLAHDEFVIARTLEAAERAFARMKV